MKGLGRLYAPDEGDRKYLLKVDAAAAKPVEYRMWRSPGVMNQENTPQCVGYAGFKWLTTSPVINRPIFSPADLYKAAQKNDEWPGEDYEGTSVRGLFKALKELGLVEKYEWAFDAETVINYILTEGPVVLGTNWYSEMDDPRGPEAYIKARGVVRGGHGYLAVGHSRKRGATRIINNWGKGWGQSGRAWLPDEDLDRLIREDGEACDAVEVKRA